MPVCLTRLLIQKHARLDHCMHCAQDPTGIVYLSYKVGTQTGQNQLLLLLCCFTSTEARWLIRDRDRAGRGRKSEGSTAETARKRPERPWTAARTMEVLRRCPLAIAQ